MPQDPGQARVLKAFGKRLRACRIAAGFDAADDFAEALNIKPATYRRYERGEVQPTFDVLIDIGRLSGKNLDFLITGNVSGKNDADGSDS